MFSLQALIALSVALLTVNPKVIALRLVITTEYVQVSSSQLGSQSQIKNENVFASPITNATVLEKVNAGPTGTGVSWFLHCLNI